jgi:aspartate 1-decarboxylase
MLSSEELESHKPTVVFVDENNKPVKLADHELHATIA